MKSRTLGAGCLTLLLTLSPGLSRAAGAGKPAADKAPAGDTVQIGMAQTMVIDVPQPLVDFLGFPFSRLTKEFTGLNGNLQIGGNAFDLAKKLEEGQVQLGVFQGLEYAWVQARHPKLKPLMVAVYQYKQLNAQLVVRKDSGLESWADLRGKDVAYPKKSKEHCRVFMERHCTECGECAPKAYFSSLARPGSVESALDELVESKCHAVIGDKVDVDFFQRIKPGAFGQLKVVKSSESFPAAVIAYREGEVDAKVLERFRSGMLKANRTERGRDMMSMWRISSFEEVPEDYQRTVEDILRAYPLHEAKASMP